MEILPTLGVPITAHAFNGDRSQVALSPNTNEVHIYTRQASSWTLSHTLTEHDKLVTGIDWAPHTNRIVSCSQDRNAYVWNYSAETATWQPTLVLLRLNRSATFVRWSPNEDKFAVASGARTIAVCQFDQESDWWVAKHIKKPLRTTVLSLDWHPNSVLLAAGSADGNARVFSAFMKGVDSKPAPTVWGERLPFNTVCGEFTSPAGGWVHGVAFSPSGDVLAFVSHDAAITIVYPSGPDAPPTAVFSIQLPTLPLVSLVFTTETSLVAAGHDCQAVVFEGSPESGWSQTKSLDDHQKRSTSGPGRAGRLAQSEAFNVFRSADSRGMSGAPGAQGVAAAGTRLTPSGTELLTLHQNTITSVRAFEGGAGQNVTQVTTSGVDGRLVMWDVAGGVSTVTQGVGKLGF
ncbi:ARP2/3 actin-organizing complex subunit Sop2 [Microbotryomycetes sp. JL221]|nr:ARP2/3 actin-organizing complex subunit Sop2 [Microbotryomycetes sp. JL221]